MILIFFLKLEPTFSDADKDGLVKEIGTQIADTMNRNLALKFNNKTSYYRLQRDNEREQLRTSIKRVSPDEPLPDEDDFREPQERVNEIFKELKMFKLVELRTDFKYGLINDNNEAKPLALETLNDVFDEQVGEKINDIENIKELETIFTDFDFNLTTISPQAIITLMCRDELFNVQTKFREYLLNKSVLTPSEIDLILRFLAQIRFHDRELIERLKINEDMKRIIDVFEKAILIPIQTGYFSIRKKQILKLSNMPHVIEQTRLRCEAENQKSYGKALGHLLNEVHGICHTLDTRSISIKKYKKRQTLEFLNLPQNANVPASIKTQIGNLFDKRNSTTVSHSGDVNNPNQDISYSDYQEFFNYVKTFFYYLFRT